MTESSAWDIFVTRSNGVSLPQTAFTANGVTVSDLVSVGGPSVNGAAGTMILMAQTSSPTVNRFLYFAESLGTFGTGYLAPPKNRNGN